MKVKFGVMGVETLKIQNEEKRHSEELCFIFLRGATCIEGKVSEQAYHEGRFVAETSLGAVSLVIDRSLRTIGPDEEGYLWAPCNIEGAWTMREYYRILTELVNKYGFTTTPSGLFWKMPEWLDGWVKDGLIDPE